MPNCVQAALSNLRRLGSIMPLSLLSSGSPAQRALRTLSCQACTLQAQGINQPQPAPPPPVIP